MCERDFCRHLPLERSRRRKEAETEVFAPTQNQWPRNGLGEFQGHMAKSVFEILFTTIGNDELSCWRLHVAKWSTRHSNGCGFEPCSG